MAKRYWVGGTATWDATAGTKWSDTSGGAGGQAVPSSADDVFFDANSGAVTVTTNASTYVSAKSVTTTNFTGSLRSGGNYNIRMYGPAVFTSSGVITVGLEFYHSGATTLTCGGNTLARLTPTAQKDSTLTLQDDLKVSGAISISPSGGSGTFNANGYNVTTGSLISGSSGTNTLQLGNGLWTLTGTGVIWKFSNVALYTFIKGNSNIKITDTSATPKIFHCQGLTYNQLWNDGAGTGFLYINEAGTFSDLKLSAGTKTSLLGGTTKTISSLTIAGTSESPVVLESEDGYVSTYSIANGGSGYSTTTTERRTLNLVGSFALAPVFRIQTVSSGVVTSVNFNAPGSNGFGCPTGVYETTNILGSGCQISIDSIDSKPGTISDSSGTNIIYDTTITDTTVSGGASFIAMDCVNNGGNTGFIFKNPKFFNSIV